MKTWEKIMLYPIGLYIWLSDGIMKMSKKWKPTMAMLMAVVMLCGMLPATVFAATDVVTVAGTNIVDGTNVTYWLCDVENGTITGEGADESNYQVKYDPATSTVTLNGATIGGDGIRRDDRYNSYNIVLAEGTTNRVTSVTGSALACAYGSIVISGAGSLNATGAANGIWADRSVTITDGANVTATGLNGFGLYSDSFFETVGITNGATAILSGSTYGIGGNADVKIDNASVTVTGDTAAFESTYNSIGGSYKWRTSESGAFTLSAETKFRANRAITRVEFIPAPAYAVIFDANGGTGTMITAEVNEGEEYTLPRCGFTAPSNKTFKAWSVGGEEKKPGNKITVSANTTVTAVWQDLVKYDLWVGGVQVTNASNITGEGITGAVSYDSTTKTLTLNNATITGAHEFSIFDDVSGIYGKETLKINLIGNNTITGSDNGGSSYGIYIDNGNLTFTGTGSLTVSAADLSENNWSVAVFAEGTITVEESCTITAYCGTNAWIASAFKSYAGSNEYNLPNATGILVAGNKNAPEATNFEVCNGDPDEFQYLRIAPGYTVTLNKNGGTINSGNVTCYFVDTGATLPTEVTKANSIFGGWYDNAECTGTAITEIPVGSTGEKEYWAKWTTAHTCSIEPVDKVWPDCENGGKEAYYKCEGCGKFFEDAAGTTEIANIETWGNLPKNGHDYGTLKAAQPEIHTATELKAGVAAHYFCDECDTYFTEGKVATTLDALTGAVPTHNYANVNGYKGEDGHADTCACGAKDTVVAHTPNIAAPTENDDQICSVCEYVIAPKLVHIHQNNLTKVPAQDADCENDGNIEYYTCTCGKWFADATASVEITDKDSVVIKGGHKYGTEWKSDADNHWNECACGDKANTAAHKDENADGKCDVCDYNVGLPTTPDGGNKPSDTPQTGDNTQLGLWIALLIVSSFGIVAITLFGKKKYSVR